MFTKTRWRLLLSYLIVFTSILVIFAAGVRFLFARSLTQQLTERLTALGQGAATNAEFENGSIKVESDFIVQPFLHKNQGLQWFDINGNSILKQGNIVLNLPLSTKKSLLKIEIGKTRIQAVILPVLGGSERKLIGYLRICQSLEELDETLTKLDLVLGSSIILALIFSAFSGVILTRLAVQPIEESFQRLKQFTADASHELRSPLMAIKSNAAVALKYPEEIRKSDIEKFQAIVSAANQMTHLTEDLLLLARSEKKCNYHKDRVNLTTILANLLSLYQPEASAKEIDLKYETGEDMYLLGNVAQLRRLFANLIENALNYTLSGGRIEVTANLVRSYLIISVQDTGAGIAPEHIKLVFERFWRADESRSYWKGGSGLGLAIAKTIAQSHGGSISLTSQVGVGSCFTVRLPSV
ncbi:ATP-binding protein [Kamptonema sp. UHCC 0994]|uniref:sensor histidine kinase n=1 Tax=Kamptonema sp. UHCC 0994 TaxID=3031329 RepID=UPI0023B92D50|nr:ATP-binding protein [Kamptonema sp. UHCC 0994]MDF0554399.1 ATP-binding protein [Kamptonema sp. UHCC 0994]